MSKPVSIPETPEELTKRLRAAGMSINDIAVFVQIAFGKWDSVNVLTCLSERRRQQRRDSQNRRAEAGRQLAFTLFDQGFGIDEVSKIVSQQVNRRAGELHRMQSAYNTWLKERAN